MRSPFILACEIPRLYVYRGKRSAIQFAISSLLSKGLSVCSLTNLLYSEWIMSVDEMSNDVILASLSFQIFFWMTKRQKNLSAVLGLSMTTCTEWAEWSVAGKPDVSEMVDGRVITTYSSIDLSSISMSGLWASLPQHLTLRMKKTPQSLRKQQDTSTTIKTKTNPPTITPIRASPDSFPMSPTTGRLPRIKIKTWHFRKMA